uniref:flagellar hook-length control protein FliK n=1 Tax=Caulobacter sp. SSI4214 TaxID=2575739 RepID=UPI001438CD03
AVAVETAAAVTAVATGKGQTTVEGKATDNAAVASIDAPTAAAAAQTAPTVDTNVFAAPIQTAPQTQATAAAAAPAEVRGSPETVAALSAEIVKKADAKTTRFDVALTPEGLGKVNVRIEIGRDGALTASMQFDTAHAAQELKGKSSELRQALSDAGFNVPDNGLSFDVSSQNGGQGSNPFLAFNGWNDQGRGGFSGRAFQAAMNADDDIAITPADLLPGLKTAAEGGLDIRI